MNGIYWYRIDFISSIHFIFIASEPASNTHFHKFISNINKIKLYFYRNILFGFYFQRTFLAAVSTKSICIFCNWINFFHCKQVNFWRRTDTLKNCCNASWHWMHVEHAALCNCAYTILFNEYFIRCMWTATDISYRMADAKLWITLIV